MWKCMDELTSYTRKDKQPINSLIINEVCTYDKREINDHLAECFNVNDDFTACANHELDKIVDNYCNNFDYSNSNQSDILPCEIKNVEISGCISKMKNKQPKNVNLPPVSIVKKCKDTFSAYLSLFFMFFINQCIMPQSFKAACVTPLFKGKGSRSSARNYRPISILNMYCKIFERFLFNRISYRVENLMCDEQHGYKKNKSCITALKEFTNYVYHEIDKPKTKVVAVMIDFSQAFNSLDKSVLIKKLMSEFKLEPWYICTIREIFRNRVFRFNNDDKYYDMPRGCCQGSSLGGLFYSLFSNDLSSRIMCKMLSYADDVILYATGTNSDEILNEVIAQFNNVCVWCSENGISVNYSKTKYMVFYKEHDTTEKSERMFFNVNGDKIERVFDFKYLGIWIDPHLNFKKHYEVVCKKVVAKLKYLIPRYQALYEY